MSKIGEKPIPLPQEIKVEVQGKKINIKGKEGEIKLDIPNQLSVSIDKGQLMVKVDKNDKTAKALHGLYRSLISNAIQGVQKAWEKKLEVTGTGFGVQLQEDDLVFKVGYSHPVVFKKKAGIKFAIEGSNKVTISGADKQLVGQIAYQIKKIKLPDVYKGKGIKYEGEHLRIKPGKKAKAAEAA